MEDGRQEPAIFNISHHGNDADVPEPVEQSSWLKRPPLVMGMAYKSRQWIGF
jgi:hypothetical protein